MNQIKLCRDCNEEIDASRLRLYPLADKCSDCAAPLASAAIKSPSKHLPKESFSDFEALVSQPSKNMDHSTGVPSRQLKTKQPKVRHTKIDFKSYVCPLCESKIKVRQLSRDEYKLTCKLCGWSDYYLRLLKEQHRKGQKYS